MWSRQSTGLSVCRAGCCSSSQYLLDTEWQQPIVVNFYPPTPATLTAHIVIKGQSLQLTELEIAPTAYLKRDLICKVQVQDGRSQGNCRDDAGCAQRPETALRQTQMVSAKIFSLTMDGPTTG
jgi:hypothetical protein